MNIGLLFVCAVSIEVFSHDTANCSPIALPLMGVGLANNHRFEFVYVRLNCNLNACKCRWVHLTKNFWTLDFENLDLEIWIFVRIFGLMISGF